MTPINRIKRTLLHDGEIAINPYELLQAACYPMLNNDSDDRVAIRLHISKDGNKTDIIEQSWPKGNTPDVGIAMHFLELKTLGYGYEGDVNALVEDNHIDNLTIEDVVLTEIELEVEVINK